MYLAGVDAAEAARTVDLTNHIEIPIREVGVSPLTVERIYFRMESPN